MIIFPTLTGCEDAELLLEKGVVVRISKNCQWTSTSPVQVNPSQPWSAEQMCLECVWVLCAVRICFSERVQCQCELKRWRENPPSARFLARFNLDITGDTAPVGP